MPRIPTSDFPQVSTSVPSGPGRNVSGDLAIARSVGQVGGQLAQLGAQLKAKQDDTESRTYAHSQKRDKVLAGMQKKRELLVEMDAETGRMGDGRLAQEHLREWSDTFTKGTMDGAPSDRAKAEFQRLDDPYSLQLEVGMQSQVSGTILTAQRLSVEKRAEESAKAVVDFTPGPGETTQSVAEELITTDSNRILSELGGTFTELEVKKLDFQQGNKIANSAIENAFSRGDTGEVMSMLGTGFWSPKMKGELSSAIKQKLRLAENEVVEHLADGSFLVTDTGAPVSPEKSLVGIAEGKRPSKIEKYLTAENKKSVVNRLGNLIEANVRGQVSNLKRGVGEFIAGATSPDPTERFKLNDGKTAGKATALVVRIENVPDSMLSPEQKEDATSSIIASLVVGDGMEVLALENPQEAKEYIGNLRGEVDRIGTALGLESVEKMGEDSAKRVMIKAKSSLTAQYARNFNALKMDGAGHLMTIDSRARRLGEQMMRDVPGSVGEFMDHADATLRRAGIPDNYARNLPKEYLKSISDEFKGFLDAGSIDSNVKAAQYLQLKKIAWDDKFLDVIKQMGTDKMPRLVVQASKYPNTAEGQSVMADIFQNAKFYGDKNQRAAITAVRPNFKTKDLKEKVNSKITLISKGIAQGFNNNNDSETIGAMRDIVLHGAARMLVEGETMSNAVEKSVAKYLTPFWTNIEHKDSNLYLPNSTMAQFKFDVDDAEAAIEAIEELAPLGDNSIDIEALPNVQRALDQAKVAPGQRQKEATKWIKNGSVGEIIAVAEGSRLIAALRQDGVSYPLKTTKGEFITIPFKGLKDNAEVLKRR